MMTSPPGAETQGRLYLKSTTKFNSVCVVNHRDSEVGSLQELFEEEAVLHDFAACWKVREQEIRNSL